MHIALGSSHLAGVGSWARVVPHLSHVAKLEPRARGRAARQAHNERLHRITHCLRVRKLTQILAMPGAHSAGETAALMLAWVRDRSSRTPARHVPVGLTERELSLYPSSHCGSRKERKSLSKRWGLRLHGEWVLPCPHAWEGCHTSGAGNEGAGCFIKHPY